VLKIAEAVQSLDCDITIIGRKSGNCCDQEMIPFRTRRYNMIFKKGFLFYKFFNIRLFFSLLFHKYDLLVSNDLDTLLPNFLVSKLKHLPLVYDSHEYFTGVPEIQNRPVVKWIWKSIEKAIFPHLKYVMTVSDSIALQYENEYGIRPLTVRNCSRNAGQIKSFSHKELGVETDHLLLILQGTGINVDRGGEEIIEAITRIAGISLLVVGSGDILNVLENKVIGAGISDRVKFIPRMPWEELMRYTKSADVGLSLDKNTNLNYSFSLPNKLFDYISAGIPVLAGDLHEIKKIVNGFGCGVIISGITPEKITEALLELKRDPSKLEEYRRNSALAAEKISWESESRIVLDLYNEILRTI
jgi:glycosyltransferase involved in cell wall biosynthesis